MRHPAMIIKLVAGLFVAAVFTAFCTFPTADAKMLTVQNSRTNQLSPDPPAGIDPHWQAAVLKKLRAQEYSISKARADFLSDTSEVYQAPNRIHRIRTYFTAEGIVVVPRNRQKPGWRWGLKPHGFGYEGAVQPVTPGSLSVLNNRAEYKHDAFTQWYVNDEHGLEQGFTLPSPPEAQVDRTGKRIVIELALSGNLTPRKKATATDIEFVSPQGDVVLRYASVYAFDASGKKLPSDLLVRQQVLSIVIDAQDAEYPILVDPMISGLGQVPDWTGQSNQDDSHFGASVMTAGDVNGDNYADVIVGAPDYDYGNADEGRVFVYHGSPGGLNTTPDWSAEGKREDARFGVSVGTAGDVNADGFSDIIIGAPYHGENGENAGAAFVYHGGRGGLDSNPGWTSAFGQANANLGFSVGSAGDVNGDGYADIIVGSPDFDGEGYAFVFHGASNGLNTRPDWEGSTNENGSKFGYAVKTAGDMNGDGYSDIIVGAPFASNPKPNAGAAYVYYGSSNGLSSNADWDIKGGQNAALLGASVFTAGDVNGDGHADIIIGAPYHTDGEYLEGAAFVFHGNSTTPSSTPSWSAFGYQSEAFFGFSVSLAGDVNGDGYADVIVGAPGYQDGQNDEGAAFVFLGSQNGLSAAPDWAAESDQVDAFMGVQVGTAGDVNGDGYADVVIGAYLYDHLYSNEGRAYVFHGSRSGLAGDPGWIKDGDQYACNFGETVSTAGDVNGDGYADVIVGAPYYDLGSIYWDTGVAYLFYGSPSGLETNVGWRFGFTSHIAKPNSLIGFSVSSAGDVNGDGYADVIVGAKGYAVTGKVFVFYGSSTGLSATHGWSDTGGGSWAEFGYAVADAGDVNGDGFADIIIGEPGLNKAHVYLGASSGLSTSPAWTYQSSLYSKFGRAVDTAGDVNGDGYSDVIVGAPDYSNDQTEEGRAFVFHGSTIGLMSSPGWLGEGNQQKAGYGSSVTTAGDVNGDGYADVIVSAPERSDGITNQGAVYVYHGSASGLNITYAWSQHGSHANNYFGHRVNCAGDVNGDGFADVIIGSIFFTNGATDEGHSAAYLGGAAGLEISPHWEMEGNSVMARLGSSVSTAGDVNGDGYADAVIGARFYNQHGRAMLFYGNQGPGLSLKPRQTTSTGLQNVANLGISDSAHEFTCNVLGRTPFGRGKVKLEVEALPLGTPFSGFSTFFTGWIDTGVAGFEMEKQVPGLSSGTAYHWRVRLHYHQAATPFQQYSRWFTRPWNGWQEKDIITGYYR